MRPKMLTVDQFNVFCAALAHLLDKRPDGVPFQQLMAPMPRRLGAEQPRPIRNGSVLVLLFPGPAGIALPLTRRRDDLPDHAGQISLPGGAWESHDTSLAETAIRETWEELGIDRKRVQLLGELTPLFIPVSAYQVYPFVACYPDPPVFSPNLVEVAEVIEVPLSVLLDPATRQEEWREQTEGQRQWVPYYRIGPHKVWGATAMILSEFLSLVENILREGMTRHN